MSCMTVRTELVLLATVLATVTLAADKADSGWPTFRGDRNQTGVYGAALADQLDPLWVYQVAEGIESTATSQNGVVYVGGLDGKLHAVDLMTGTPKWVYEATAEIKSSPTIAGLKIL